MSSHSPSREVIDVLIHESRQLGCYLCGKDVEQLGCYERPESTEFPFGPAQRIRCLACKHPSFDYQEKLAIPTAGSAKVQTGEQSAKNDVPDGRFNKFKIKNIPKEAPYWYCCQCYGGAHPLLYKDRCNTVGCFHLRSQCCVVVMTSNPTNSVIISLGLKKNVQDDTGNGVELVKVKNNIEAKANAGASELIETQERVNKTNTLNTAPKSSSQSDLMDWHSASTPSGRRKWQAWRDPATGRLYKIAVSVPVSTRDSMNYSIGANFIRLVPKHHPITREEKEGSSSAAERQGIDKGITRNIADGQPFEKLSTIRKKGFGHSANPPDVETAFPLSDPEEEPAILQRAPVHGAGDLRQRSQPHSAPSGLNVPLSTRGGKDIGMGIGEVRTRTGNDQLSTVSEAISEVSNDDQTSPDQGPFTLGVNLTEKQDSPSFNIHLTENDKIVPCVSEETFIDTFIDIKSESLAKVDLSQIAIEGSSVVSFNFSNDESSSMTSCSTSHIERPAFNEILSLFLHDESFRDILEHASVLGQRKRIIRNFARLLEHYAEGLANNATEAVEFEAAKFFQNRRRCKQFTSRILERISENYCREVIDTNLLEIYLKGKTAPNESSSDSGESEPQPLRFVAQAKRFLTSGEPFERLLEEMQDFIFPFSPNNFFWDGQDLVRFEQSAITSSTTIIDRTKLWVKEKLNMEILWWPLDQPRQDIKFGNVRIRWSCECGKETYIDAPKKLARTYRKTCSITRPVLPTHSSSVQTNSQSSRALTSSFKSSISSLRSSFMHRLGWKDNESTNSANSGNGKSIEVVCEAPRLPKYIHWCVDTADRRTFMDHICIEEKQGPAFVEDLNRRYKARRGWRWLFSLTTCAEIKLVKLIRVHEDEDEVACLPEGVLPNLNEEKNYQYRMLRLA